MPSTKMLLRNGGYCCTGCSLRLDHWFNITDVLILKESISSQE